MARFEGSTVISMHCFVFANSGPYKSDAVNVSLVLSLVGKGLNTFDILGNSVYHAIG